MTPAADASREPLAIDARRPKSVALIMVRDVSIAMIRIPIIFSKSVVLGLAQVVCFAPSMILEIAGRCRKLESHSCGSPYDCVVDHVCRWYQGAKERARGEPDG